jgi:hypothetical protein
VTPIRSSPWGRLLRLRLLSTDMRKVDAVLTFGLRMATHIIP